MGISSADDQDNTFPATAAATIASATTNAEDQKAVAELKKRLAATNNNDAVSSSAPRRSFSWEPVPFVSIEEGQWKYVLISATEPFCVSSSEKFITCSDDSSSMNDNSGIGSGIGCGRREDNVVFFVTSKRGAAYHRNAAEPLVERLQSNGYRNIHVMGGGRLHLNSEDKKIHIFGFSYGFGLADHAISKRVIEQDERFQDYEITWSNEGY